ncbi:hypothetical protein H5410_017329 [Solanum commersonii]|uniref:RNA polymerase sigma-70 region 2 domain-containing protein n=1 Tax=Solanum commersonii TaxID=4109 RepID=A0A9J5ZYZ6_SOLCO|nr:hypothetical protein H5410_017329 [Solanum commersonii]
MLFLEAVKDVSLCFYETMENFRLKERLGCETSDYQLALSLKLSLTDLRSTLIECSLARERFSMSSVRLVMSIAQRYDNMGPEMTDLVRGGLIGLLHGIEKFDPSKGYKIPTYVYWWICQPPLHRYNQERATAVQYNESHVMAQSSHSTYNAANPLSAARNGASWGKDSVVSSLFGFEDTHKISVRLAKGRMYVKLILTFVGWIGCFYRQTAQKKGNKVGLKKNNDNKNSKITKSNEANETMSSSEAKRSWPENIDEIAT